MKKTMTTEKPTTIEPTAPTISRDYDVRDLAEQIYDPRGMTPDDWHLLIDRIEAMCCEEWRALERLVWEMHGALPEYESPDEYPPAIQRLNELDKSDFGWASSDYRTSAFKLGIPKLVYDRLWLRNALIYSIGKDGRCWTLGRTWAYREAKELARAGAGQVIKKGGSWARNEARARRAWKAHLEEVAEREAARRRQEEWEAASPERKQQILDEKWARYLSTRRA